MLSKLNLSIALSIFLSGLCVSVSAKEHTLVKNEVSGLTEIIKKYSESVAFEADFNKKDTKKTLGTTQTSSGKMVYSAGKIKIALEGEKKSDILFNGHKLWVIEYPDKDFDPQGKRKVMEMGDHKPALAQQLMSLFQKPSAFKKDFKIVSEKFSDEKKQLKQVEYSPKNPGIKNFIVEYDLRKRLIQSIQFTDDVQTETSISFKKTKFLNKVSKDIFNYKRKKDDEVL